jgi:hypothetical protein
MSKPHAWVDIVCADDGALATALRAVLDLWGVPKPVAEAWPALCVPAARLSPAQTDPPAALVRGGRWHRSCAAASS